MTNLTPLGTKWRGMTVSSVFQLPGFLLLIVVGFAIVVTMLMTGHRSELKSQPEPTPKYSETGSGGK